MPAVVLIMIDGLRPEAVTPEHCPNLVGLMERGAFTLHAQSVMPCITLPCHMSIFHSVPPTRHGVTTNTWSPMARWIPGLVEVAHAAGKRCAFIHNWEPLRNLNVPEMLWLSHFRDTAYDRDGDEWVAADAAQIIAQHQPDFTFIYLGTVDTTGHNHGWLSPEYLAQARAVDALLPQIFKALAPDTTLLLHADHGGHERNHGTDTPADMTIPWVIAGPRVRVNYEIQSPVSLLDTAPTAAKVLGLTLQREWEGKWVKEAFTVSPSP